MKRIALLLGLVLVAGCASAPPPPPPITPDPVKPPGHWEMSVADDQPAPPPAVHENKVDKPNVATSVKRSLITIGKKSQ